jgi:C4-dicarboxylate transporter DctQ subunit
MKRIWKGINMLEELFLGYTLLLIALVATFQVLMRYAFGIAYDWFTEWARYLTVLIAFMGAGLGVKYGTHFSMEALTQYSPDRVAHLLKVAGNLVAAFTMGVVCYYSWIQIGKLARFGVLTPATEVPMWIPYLPIGLFSAVISVRFLLQTLRHAKAFLSREPFQRVRGEP